MHLSISPVLKSSEGTVSPASLLFTPANSSVTQTVTVTGVDDHLGDGTIDYMITLSMSSSDNIYNALADINITAANADNDTPGITVNPNENNATLATFEPTPSKPAGKAIFTIMLNTKPTVDVTIPLTSTDTTEGILSLPAVTSTPDNWDRPRRSR